MLTPSLQPRSWRRAVGLLGTAVVASIAGFLAVDNPAQACSCAEPNWRLELRSVSAGAGAPSHQANWPVRANLSAYPGTAILNSEGYEPDQLHRVEGSSR